MPNRDTDFGACVINLDSSRDRRAAMEAEFARAGLPWRRVPGVLAKAIPDDLKPHFMDPSGRPLSRLTPGEIGCFAAHLSIMARMAAGELEPVMLVLEDDCSLPAGLKADLRSLLQRLPPAWDMVRLCNLPKRAYVPLDDPPSGPALIRYSTVPNFTGAYLCSVAGARKLLAGGPKTLPFDGYLREGWRHGCDVYGVWPPMITQGREASCIDGIDEVLQLPRSRKDGRVDRVGIARRVAWQIGVLGGPAWFGCQVVDAADAILRHVTRRTLVHAAAPLLRPLRRRPPWFSLALDDAAPGRTRLTLSTAKAAEEPNA